jgi:two-component system, cell cycle sensor histidine kinase and response regulator CckA
MAEPSADPNPPPEKPEFGDQELYRLILNATLDAVVTIDEAGRVVDWNGRAEDIFGWSAREVAGKPVADFLIPHSMREKHIKGFAHFLATGEGPILDKRLELPSMRKNGDEIPIELTISPTRRNGEWIFIAFLRDLTGELKAKQRLEAQNSILKILTAAPSLEQGEREIMEAICGQEPWVYGTFWRRAATPREERIHCGSTYMKPDAGAERFHERTLAQSFSKGEGFPGRIWESRRAQWTDDPEGYGPIRGPEALRDGLNAAYGFPVIVDDEVIGVFEFLGRSANRLDRALLESISAVAGQIGLFFRTKSSEAALKEEIEANKRAREELSRRERRFRALIENSSDAISIYGLDGIISYASPSTETVLGYSESEFVGKLGYSLIHPEDLPDLRKTFKEVIDSPGIRFKVEARMRHKDGSWRWVVGSAINLLNDPLIGGILSNYRDVTEEKTANQRKEMAEDQLRQAQKMEAVGRLAGGIAHDFNNLLTSINGYSAMALETLNPEGQLKDFLQEILKSGERAAGLTKQLLAYSRKQTLAPKLWDLTEIVLGMENMLRRIIGEDIDLTVKHGPEPSIGKVDRGQVEQIILNLVLNARDAMPHGGKLILETGIVELSDAYTATHLDWTPGTCVMLAVSDSGTGMTESVKTHLFEPFFTTKEAGKGTGLGLSSVYGIVKQSGGSINVYSEPGVGTTFRIYFPKAGAERPEAAETPAAGGPERLRGGETILLVEDEESVRNFAVQALEIQGYRVFTAANGREALAFMKDPASVPIDLLITDVVMPDIGGQALAARMKESRPSMPILFISGYTETTVTYRGFIDEGEPFLQKPFGPTDLARKAREALDRKPAAPAADRSDRNR